MVEGLTNCVTASGNHTSTSNEPPPTSKESNTGAIAGGIVGGIVGLLIIGFVVWWFFFKKTKSKFGSISRHSKYVDNIDFDQRQELASPRGGGKHELALNQLSPSAGKAELTEEAKPRHQDIYEM